MRKARFTAFLLLAVLFMSLAVPILAEAACANSSSGFIGWWKGENNANDQLALNNGTLHGGATFAPGKVGQAFNLDGVNGYIIIPSSDSSLKPTDAITLEAWIYPKDVGTDQHIISTAGSGPSPFGHDFYMRLVSSNIEFRINDNPLGSGSVITSTSQWYHVAATYDRISGQRKIYINGTLANNNSYSSAINTGHTYVTIGVNARNVAYGENFASFNGMLDEVAIYNRALSADEIAAHYNAGTDGICIATVPSAFSFTSQTGMPLSTTVISNPITVTGNTQTDTHTDISITGGDYAISTDGGGTWGSWTSSAGTVGVNNQIMVRLNSSPSYSTMTTATLTIGGVSGAFNVTTAASGDPNANGLVAWWKAENNAYDSLGGNNGTLQGGATYASGKVGQAFSLDGSSGYIQLTDSSALKPSYLTVEAWINLSSSPSAYGIIFDNETGNPWYGYSLYVSSANKLVAEVHAGSLVTVTGTTTLQLDTWYHVALTYDGSTIKTYINGVLESSAANTGVIDYTSSINPKIGMRATSNAYPFPGLIDEVKIFNRALSAGEIAKLYGTVPDAFSFIAQTGMPLNTTIFSNPITVTGISYPIAVLISGGEYQINGGSWASSVGTVSNGDVVIVRQTSSSSNSTLTTATLTVGDASAAFNVTTAASGDPNASGLVAWWRAENNALDSVGGNHGTAMNGAIYATGKVGQAFSLDGVDDYVEIPNSGSLNPASAITVATWYRPVSFEGDGNNAIISKGYSSHTAPYYEYHLGVNGDQYHSTSSTPANFSFGVSPNNNFINVQTAENIWIPGNWYHLAGTYDGSNVKLYVNGILQASMPATGTLSDYGKSLRIGAFNNISRAIDYTPGLIDEVKIFNRALSATEVGKLSGQVPDTFSFIAQTAMPISTTIVSNPVTITGIGFPTAISITGGEYSISTDGGSSWGTWSSAAGTVSANNQVMVRQTSSAINSTMTAATLTIGGVAGVFNATTAASSDPNASGLVSWWRAENNAYDSVGGNHGTLMNGMIYAAGKIGQAFSFDGIDDSVRIPHNDSLNPVGDQTIAFWINFDSMPGDYRDIIEKGIGVGGIAEYYIRTNNANGMNFGWCNTSHCYLIDPSYSSLGITAGNWYHIAFVINHSSQVAYVYVNGAQKDSTTGYAVSYAANTSDFTIGGFTWDGYFPGRIDETKIFNRALSALEVSTLAGTKPDAFSFTAQTGVALSTPIESNAITVTGITNPAAISITGGEYSVSTDGGGSWSAYSSTTPATVSVTNQVKVRQTSSGSYSTMTTATLTIGGVSGTFNVTTIPLLYTLTVTKAGTGSGTVAVNSGSLSWSGPTGTASYIPHTSVDLSASADSGSSFIGFTVDCISNTSPCTVTMDSAKSVTATFNSKADFTGTPLSGSVPHNVTFTDASTHSPTIWSWTFGDGGTSTQKNPVHTYRTNGTYTVTLTATGAGGASTMTKNGYITVGPDACTNGPYKIGGTPYSYDTIQHAYDSPGTAGMVQIQALVFTGGLMLNQSKNLTLQGGYDCGFTSNVGETILSDKLTVKDGKVTIDKLTIK